MAAMLRSSPVGLKALPSRARQARVGPAKVAPVAVARPSVAVSAKVQSAEKAAKLAAPSMLASMIAAPAMAAQEAIGDLGLEVNILGVIAVALFIIIPTSFLIVIYVKSVSDGQASGGFSQSYYSASKKAGKKKTNEAAVFKGKGVDMYSQD
eukprot:CAMPEP_0170134406 /NCGR_PEP_ID=MMETSP0033_2-20121228/1877_1 /TAXON_ID=195969 /ORGANISM="Dolichomastix tenuilepis, Strain CCMP3274" /LENGTH=151 /DNA_ID=CAMNT_0010369957 /DNA_START=107 /DNA_END=562 /DNA_ORIENTATION=-